MRFSRYSGVSHIVMDQLVEGPLSLARAVPEVNPIAMALRKEQPKCRADSQMKFRAPLAGNPIETTGSVQ